MDTEHLDIQSGYDLWATIYDGEGNPLVALEEPVVHGWIGDPVGVRVADVGCGTGRHTHWLAARGAEVDGFDASAGMLSKAREKLRALSVRFYEHMLPERLPVGNDQYDCTLLCLVADHLSDLTMCFGELDRITRPGGRLVFTTLHPAMNLLGITARFTHPQSGHEVRVSAHEHTYGDYVLAALRAGLFIEEILERKADQALAAQTPRAEKYLGWPMLLAMKLKKPEAM